MGRPRFLDLELHQHLHNYGERTSPGQLGIPREKVEDLMYQRSERAKNPHGKGVIGYELSSLRGLIRSYHKRKCKDPRDHIYAFLSLVRHYGSADSEIKPNYAEDSREIFFEVLNYLYMEGKARGDFDISNDLIHRASMAERVVEALLEKERFSFFYGPLLDDFGDFLNSPKWLQFDCYYGGKISWTGPERNSTVPSVLCVEIEDDRDVPYPLTPKHLEAKGGLFPPYLDQREGNGPKKHSGLAQLSVELGDHVYMFRQSSLAIAVRPSAQADSAFTIAGKLIVALIPDTCDAMSRRGMQWVNRGFFETEWNSANACLIKRELDGDAPMATTKVILGLDRRESLQLFHESTATHNYREMSLSNWN